MRPDDDKGLLWKLPVLKSQELGKVGPAFVLGAGCGFGFGLGFVGGAGLGPGLPGLHLGYGVGIGCGVGVGFGYGFGKGIAHDENRSYSNVRKFFHGPRNVPSQEDLGALLDDLVVTTKKLVVITTKEIEKWRR